MEEDLNDNELEERFYTALNYVEEVPENITNNKKDVDHIVESTPQSTVRRYWRTSGDQTLEKTKSAKDANLPINKNPVVENPKTKADKHNQSHPVSVDLSIFQSPVPKYVKKTIEIIENEEPSNIVELESSDEDEVIEVKLPPKPTITIESSDDDDDDISVICAVVPFDSIDAIKVAPESKSTANRSDREVSASPVPSIVSSVSDEFIRGDCIALNISSKRPNNQSFDFSLHGSDIVDQSTPPKKKKKKKNKESTTSTPIVSTPIAVTPPSQEGDLFATPKSKAKNKRQKAKNYSVSEKSIPSADVYDSDSNQSTNDLDKSQRSYIVTDRSFPSADVYESDSNLSEKVSPSKKQNEHDTCTTSDSSVSADPPSKVAENSKMSKRKNSVTEHTNLTTVDLTDATLDGTAIEENIVMANVTGFESVEVPVDDGTLQNVATNYGSTKVPAILYDNLDFDNLKGKGKVCKKRRYSMTTLRAEMEKFYNESWGGENFNHREIQKNMSRDKSLWVIDPKDRMPGLSRRKPNCGYCNRSGHREDTCRMKPAVCYMCGSDGHFEPRCPRKICVSCGSPNHMYTTMCRNCSNWHNIRCAECGQMGHPSSHCPDLWRRYHNTLTCNTPLEENRQVKRHYQLFCSGCARRGHLIHTCRVSLPFSGLPINSPYVALYNQVPFLRDTQKRAMRPNTQDSTISSATIQRNDRLKRQSTSPAPYENVSNKRRNTSNSEETDTRRNTKSPLVDKTQQSKETETNKGTDDTAKVANNTEPPKTPNAIEKAPDFISIASTNHDKRGQIIQDNEVSDTSDAVTTSRIYVTSEIIEKLKTTDGDEWLKKTTEKHNVTTQNAGFNVFLCITGKVGDQEAFQSELRDWIKSEETADTNINNDLIQNDTNNDSMCNNIPKNRYNVLRKINKALDSLKADLGDPKDMYKELNYLQNHHLQLMKQKQISPKQLTNNRQHINVMLKKLNMILLGQAGLAGGSKHLRQLYTIQEKLTNFRQKNITNQMRWEIGQHYRHIFTALPREDYKELLNMYYVAKAKPFFKKKKQDKPLMISPITHAKKKFVKSWQKMKHVRDGLQGGKGGIDGGYPIREPLFDKTLNKLVFYHRRLMSTKPHDSVLNKTRVELVNKLNSHISSLGNNKMSPKSLRKMRKKMKITQEQAQLFLANV